MVEITIYSSTRALARVHSLSTAAVAIAQCEACRRAQYVAIVKPHNSLCTELSLSSVTADYIFHPSTLNRQGTESCTGTDGKDISYRPCSLSLLVPDIPKPFAQLLYSQQARSQARRIKSYIRTSSLSSVAISNVLGQKIVQSKVQEVHQHCLGSLFASSVEKEPVSLSIYFLFHNFQNSLMAADLNS